MVTETAFPPALPVVVLRLCMFDLRPRDATALVMAVRRSNSAPAAATPIPFPEHRLRDTYTPTTAERTSTP